MTDRELMQEPVVIDADGTIRLLKHPPRREWQGLTDDEINTAAYNNHPLDGIRAFARAVESKLKEKNGF
jgi:hypothetical protein